MTCLLLRLAGPMQSWGTQSRFGVRDTGREPSKSGVIGLLCAAVGIDRSDDTALAPLAALTMAVRVDHEGVFSRDFHTAGGGSLNGQDYGVIKASGAKGDTVLSERFYLADAEFLVALEGPEPLLRQLEAALVQPVWTLWLGRKSFTPTPPLCLEIMEGSAKEVLEKIPWHQRAREKAPPYLRLVLECARGEGATRMDVPLSFVEGARRFASRHVRMDQLKDFKKVDETGKELQSCISPA
jgi:CRISPR system Cascade subunit CasD